jgi:hypothetical protein
MRLLITIALLSLTVGCYTQEDADRKTAINLKAQMRVSYDVILERVQCHHEWDCTQRACFRFVKERVSDARFDQVARFTCY